VGVSRGAGQRNGGARQAAHFSVAKSDFSRSGFFTSKLICLRMPAYSASRSCRGELVRVEPKSEDVSVLLIRRAIRRVLRPIEMQNALEEIADSESVTPGHERFRTQRRRHIATGQLDPWQTRSTPCAYAPCRAGLLFGIDKARSIFRRRDARGGVVKNRKRPAIG